MVVGQRDDPARPSRVFGLQKNSPAEVHLIKQTWIDVPIRQPKQHSFGESARLFLVGVYVHVCVCACIKKAISLVEL